MGRFGVFCLVAGIGMTAMGLTDPKVTELLRWSWAPTVLGVILLAVRRGGPRQSAADGQSFGNQTLDALASAHGFTREQLEHNRAGRIHPQQMASGVSLGQSDVLGGGLSLGLGLILLVAGVALPWFPRALIDQDFTFAVPAKLGAAIIAGLMIGGVVGAYPLMFGAMAWRHGQRIVSCYSAGIAGHAEGPLEKVRAHERGMGSSYFYVVGRRRLWVTRSAWESAHAGQNHRVFFVPGCNRLLSLEPL